MSFARDDESGGSGCGVVAIIVVIVLFIAGLVASFLYVRVRAFPEPSVPGPKNVEAGSTVLERPDPP